MKHKLGILVTVTALVLAGCSSGEDAASTITPAAPAPEETAQQAPSEKAKLGEPINVSTTGNEVMLTITDISIGEECRHGLYEGSEFDPQAGEIPEGKQLLQVSGELDVVKKSNGPGMMDDPTIVDSEGFTQNPEMYIDCEFDSAGYDIWYTPASEGEKRRIYGAYLIPTGAKQVEVGGVTFDVAAV